MNSNDPQLDELKSPISRRRFVQGIVSVGALAVMSGAGIGAFAESDSQTPPVLSGTHFNLGINKMPVNFTGRRATAIGINGSSPGPTLRWREGDTVNIAVTNRLNVPSSIHWHGMRIPADMDGVPGLSYREIAPGETFVYRFPVRQNGTYWYHSHAGFQEQIGLLGAIVIEPREQDALDFDREYVVLLSDWTDADPEVIFSNLKQESDYYNYYRFTLANFLADAKKSGLTPTLRKHLAWGRMNMSPNDIADVSGAAYTYLLNGNPPRANWTGLFRPGERVRLRFINGSSMTFFDVRIPGLPMTVVQADGNDVEPVEVDEFRMGVAETYDVVVQSAASTAYTIFAQAEDRTGFARGTLTPTLGLTAAVPPMDPRPTRTMMDMGMGSMGGMKMSGMQGMSGMQMTGMKMNDAPDMNGMQMDGADMTASRAATPAKGSAHETMPGMQSHSGAGTTPFPQPGSHTVRMKGMTGEQVKLQPSHPSNIHIGPQVAAMPMSVSSRLNDPGDGLEHNGRRVLTYADLRARYRGVDGRPPTREIELHLTGNMERFIWGLTGRSSPAQNLFN
jgi:CopA family copper-resistance protein